ARDHYLIGRDLLDKLRIPEARRHLEQAVARDSTFAIAHYDLALSEVTNRGFLEHLTRAVDLSETASDGERLMIMALYAGANADPVKQRKLYEELASSYPLDPRAHFLLGFSQAGQQDFDQAIQSFTRATELDPEFSPAWNALGYAYRPLGRYEQAERAFKRYIALIPNEPNPYDSYAELLLKIGRHDESIAMYRKALEADSHFVPSFVGIAANLMYSGRHADARKEVERLRRTARDDRERRTALLTTAITWADEGKVGGALDALNERQQVARRTGDTLAMVEDLELMGALLVEAGRTNEAQSRFRQAAALVEQSSATPEIKADAQLRNRADLARVAIKKRDLAGARTLADSVLKAAQAGGNPDRIREAHELLGLIDLAQKKAGEATEHLKEADQQDPYVLYALARAQALSGDREGARALFAKVASHNDLPTIRYAMVRQAARAAATRSN
ncbi:MAG TPA: tetratricopeptide repeat protein, partial [Gemmatimonadales bacterium]|nr:tetratricopeptide repeat protein [Gemmatimonadales bacterium]